MVTSRSIPPNSSTTSAMPLLGLHLHQRIEHGHRGRNEAHIAPVRSQVELCIAPKQWLRSRICTIPQILSSEVS